MLNRAAHSGPGSLCFSQTHLFPSSTPDVTRVLPDFPALDLENTLLQEGIAINDLKSLQLLYRRHCEVTVKPGGPLWVPLPWRCQLMASLWNLVGGAGVLLEQQFPLFFGKGSHDCSPSQTVLRFVSVLSGQC